MIEAEKIDYEKAYHSMRFFQEYLLKVFNFSTIINGAVFSIFLSSTDLRLRLGLAIFALSVSTVCYLIYIRIHSATLIYRELLIEAERSRGLETFQRLRNHPHHFGIRMGKLFHVLYASVLAAWVIAILWVVRVSL